MAARRAVAVAVAIAAALALLAIAATSAEASYGFTLRPSAGPEGSTFTLSFRAPFDENSDCCSEVKYEFWLHGPRDACIRDWFGYMQRRSNGREQVLTSLAGTRHMALRVNGHRLGDNFISAGDAVVVRFRAPPCVGRYRGAVRWVDSELSSTTTELIGTFRFRVTG